jgi:hypothetical protein
MAKIALPNNTCKCALKVRVSFSVSNKLSTAARTTADKSFTLPGSFTRPVLQCVFSVRFLSEL